ncbi:shikimate kinase [Saccharomonospora amisosensis]|uniref:Shikimate kinase n=1 Tax=Saccharomonospora amisosensis TaxID=1128677 RepID=A0A7X5UPE0_9PSEU|nr:shikimate kinase [Saccharomonospora amisosensis]NIJ11671.1 shikimate kinase [Saccharomonospora amisosensis]
MTARGPIVVVGPPGSGKSTVGPLLANRLGKPYHDADAELEASTGRRIADIFATDGEEVFRAIEEEVVAEGLARDDGVYALGGGAVLSERTRKRLLGHIVVFLNVGMAEGVRRTGMSTARPLLAGINPRATYKALLEARLPVYRAVATVEVDTDDRSPDEVADQVVERLREGGVPESAPGNNTTEHSTKER